MASRLGIDPLIALAVSIGAVIAGALALYGFGPVLLDAPEGGVATLIVLSTLCIPGLAVLLGVAVVVMAFGDLRSTVEVTGPILRLRAFGEEKKRRYYVAVDDGVSGTIRAWRVSPMQYSDLEQGEAVTVALTKNLACVRSIVRAEALAPE